MQQERGNVLAAAMLPDYRGKPYAASGPDRRREAGSAMVGEQAAVELHQLVRQTPKKKLVGTTPVVTLR